MGGLPGPWRSRGGIAEQQVPSRGPQAWHHLPLANTASACGEPRPSQASAWALPWLPQETKLLFIKQRRPLRSDCRVCVPNPAESKGARSSEGFLEERAGPEWPQGAPAEPPIHAAEATWG